MHVTDRLNPLISRARPRFGLRNKYHEVATRSWELAPATESIVPPAIFEPTDIDKILGVGADDTLEGQVERAHGGRFQHRASVAYEVPHAVLSNGNLFSRKAVLPLRGKKLSLVARGHAPEYKDAVMASSGYGCRYFGHWMADDLPRTLAAYEIGHPVSVLTEPSRAQRDFLRLLDLKPDEVSDAYFERVVVIDDVGQNDYKRQRYERLQTLAKRHVPHGNARAIMLLRGNGGVKRTLTNEFEVAEMARRRGMTVLDPTVMSGEEILKASVGAELILGVEGSQLCNSLMWMSFTGTVVTIQPPQRFMLVIKDWCDCVGIRYAFIVADKAEADNFHVDVSALERLLDRTSNVNPDAQQRRWLDCV